MIRIVGVFGTTDQGIAERLVGCELRVAEKTKPFPARSVFIADNISYTTIVKHIMSSQDSLPDSVIVFMWARRPDDSIYDSPSMRKLRNELHEIWEISNGQVKKLKDRYDIDGTNVCTMCGHKHPPHHACMRAVQEEEELEQESCEYIWDGSGDHQHECMRGNANHAVQHRCLCGEVKKVQKKPSASKQPVATSKKSAMRMFVLERAEDVSGTSGTGIVAEGVVFSNGHVAYSWLSPLASVTTVQSVDVVEKLHGHGGRTVVRYIDDEERDG